MARVSHHTLGAFYLSSGEVWPVGLGRGRFAANVLSRRVVTLVRSQKATKKQNGKC